MQRPKMMIHGATAVIVLGATITTSAHAGVEFLNAEGKPTAATYQGTSEKPAKYSTLGNSLEITCKRTQKEGAMEGTGKLGTFHLTAEKCTTTLGGECTGLGDTAGTILVLGTQHLATNAGLGYVLFLIEHLHFSCTVLFVTKLFLVLGELLCELKPINVLTSKLTVVCKKGAERGDPAVTSYGNDKGEAATLTNALQSSEGDTTETMAALEAEFEVAIVPSVKLDV